MSWISSIRASGRHLDSLEDLFMEEFKEVCDGEDQLIEALPKIAQAASTPQLKTIFEQHLEETRRQRTRLDEVFSRLGKEADTQTSLSMKALLEDGEVLMKAQGDPKVKDAAMIAAAQRVEHYEMACYGTLRSWAQQLGWTDVADILQGILDEEKKADKQLTDEALSEVNVMARR